MRWLALILTPLLLGSAAMAQTVVPLTIAERNVAGAALEQSGGAAVLRVTQGETVEIAWSSDEATELHLHGYDIEVDVAPGETNAMTFEARATGRFAIEAHGFGPNHGDKTLLYLEVLPR